MHQEDDSLELDGMIDIRTGPPREGLPLVLAETCLRDTHTGEPIITATRVTITFNPDNTAVTANVEELCTPDGNPLHGAPVQPEDAFTHEYRAWLNSDMTEPFTGDTHATKTFHYAVHSITNT